MLGKVLFFVGSASPPRGTDPRRTDVPASAAASAAAQERVAWPLGMAEEQGTVVDGIVGEFSSYEDYLDSQISPTDLYYLEDEDLARQLVVRAQTRLAPSCMACT